jgi:ribosomal protein S18 acetylase RimI-like enzyme
MTRVEALPQATSATVALRDALPSEAPALAALVNRAYRVEDFFIDGDRTTEAEVAGMFSHATFLVAEGEGRLAGAVYISADGPRGHFGMLAVDPACQATGLGSFLVEAAEQRLRQSGCVSVSIDVINLRSELLPWYRRRGYVEAGTGPFPAPEKAKLPCHCIIMTRSLAPGRP